MILGVGISTLNKWVTAHRDTDVVSQGGFKTLPQENERLRRENRHSQGGEGDPKKGTAVLRGPKAMRFRFIEEHRSSFPANRMCEVAGCQFAWSAGISAAALPVVGSEPTWSLLAHIKEQSRLSLGSYGRPRMTEELKEIGLDIGHRRVGRLMRQNGISVVRTRKHKVTTDSNHKFNIAPDLLDRDFMADAPNQKWAGDISYVWTREGWLYLAVILDLHSRRVIGWAVSNRMKRDLAIRALKMAIAFRSPPKDCIHHTDRGSQYCSQDYRKILRQHGFKVSMSGKG